MIISGAGGQLGKACLRCFPFSEDFSVYTFDRHQLDIADKDKIYRTLDLLPQVRYWINCGAYTKVDDAETHIRDASVSNAIAPGYIAEACSERNIHLVHFSSDYVYHNGLNRPLREDDPTWPRGIYAQTKLEGEIGVQQSGASHTILRTSWVYGPEGHNFVNTMLRLGKTKEEVSVVGDQTGAPTYTIDIANAVKSLLQQHAAGHKNAIQGIFNFANSGQTTWDEFARTIFHHANLTCKVKTISTQEYGAPAPRPAYSVLNCEKIAALLSTPIAHWEDALTRYLKTIQ
jgi:dTDP-4-dehydrorhamnose reductase